MPLLRHQQPQREDGGSGSRASGAELAAAAPTPPTRSVARPLQNLGSTCFVNCVLQALGHAPELCLAVDAEPHRQSCPVAAENEQVLLAQAAAAADAAAAEAVTGSSSRASPRSPSASRAPSPEEAAAGTLRRSSRGGGGGNGSGSGNGRGRRSPSSSSPSSNNGNGGGKGREPPGATIPAAASELKFCVLCELEKHLAAVHDAGNGGSGGNGSNSEGGGKSASQVHSPSDFVRGFFEHAAPWFKLGTQEDAHEFLRLLIDAMQKSARNARLQHNPQDDDDGRNSGGGSGGGRSAGKGEGGGDAAPAALHTNTAVSEEDTEYPFSLFRGTVESKVVCESCGASSATLDPIEDVGLDVVSRGVPPAAPAAKGVTAPAAPATRSSRNASPPAPAGGGGALSSSAAAISSAASSAGKGRPLAGVTAALQRFARVEVVDGYKCERCHTTGRATKQSRLAAVPPILTLHLKRFRYGADAHVGIPSAASAGGGFGGGAADTAPGPGAAVVTRSSRSSASLAAAHGSGIGGGGGMGVQQDYALGGKSGSAKIEGHVGFQELINLLPYLTPEVQAATAPSAAFCRLFAVVVHAGKNSHSGHYIAYVQSLAKDGWYKMDDGRVSQVESKEVLKADAYLLFYRVVQHPVTSALKDRLAARESRREAAAASESASERDGAPGGKRGRSPRTSAAYRDGEEWARAKAPRLLGAASRAQRLVSEAIELTHGCLERIGDEASGGRGPSRIEVGEDDVAGGVSHVRQKLAELFYRLAKHYDGDGDGAAAASSSGPARALPPGFFGAAPGEAKQRAEPSSTVPGAALAQTVEPKPSAPADDAADLL